MTDREDGRDFLVRLLDSMRDDVQEIRREVDQIRRDGTETDRYARAAFSRVEACEDKIAEMREVVVKMDGENKLTTAEMNTIKAVAKTVGKGAGALWGLVGGALGGFLATWLQKLLHP